MSISDEPDSKLFGWLSNSASLLEHPDLKDLKRSKIIIDNIQEQIKTEIPKINSTTLNEKFKNLQNALKEEFSQRGEHSKNVFMQLRDSVLKTWKTNLEESQKIFENNTQYDERYKRMDSYSIYNTFIQFISRSNPSKEELFVGISFAYSHLVNGIYASALRDCYAWKKLSLGKPLDESEGASWFKQQEIHNIYDYFKGNSLPLHYFNGWNRIVRNAVAHSNFRYDKTTQKMTYVNDPIGSKVSVHVVPSARGSTHARRPPPCVKIGFSAEPREQIHSKKYKTTDYDLSDIEEKIEQLLAVYWAVLVTNTIAVVSSCCKEFSQRYH